MPRSTDRTDRDFRQLPEPVDLGRTVATADDAPVPEPAGEQNAFIAAAIRAGG